MGDVCVPTAVCWNALAQCELAHLPSPFRSSPQTLPRICTLHHSIHHHSTPPPLFQESDAGKPKSKLAKEKDDRLAKLQNAYGECTCVRVDGVRRGVCMYVCTASIPHTSKRATLSLESIVAMWSACLPRSTSAERTQHQQKG
jgi:hypothetical protein